MRKIIFPLFLFAAMAASAQQTMRDVLRQMPDSIVPYLTENNRLDFIDFIDSNMRAEVANSLGGRSELLQLTDAYAALSLNEASRIDMRLLDTTEPVDSATQVLCLVRTYGTDIRESTVDFYSLRWRRLDVPLALPAGIDMFRATLGSEQPTLTVTPECRLDAPANEEQEEIVKPSTILNWDGKSFK